MRRLFAVHSRDRKRRAGRRTATRRGPGTDDARTTPANKRTSRRSSTQVKSALLPPHAGVLDATISVSDTHLILTNPSKFSGNWRALLSGPLLRLGWLVSVNVPVTTSANHAQIPKRTPTIAAIPQVFNYAGTDALASFRAPTGCRHATRSLVLFLALLSDARLRLRW